MSLWEGAIAHVKCFIHSMDCQSQIIFGSSVEVLCVLVCAPFADTFISKTKKLYMDTRTQRNISKLTEDLSEVHSIMTRNIADVLGQGERLDSESDALLPSTQFQTL